AYISVLCKVVLINTGNSNVVVGVAGLTADANSLVNFARTAAQRHLFTFNEDIPVEQLAQRLCDLKQGYTQYGATCIGANNGTAQSLLKQEYKEDIKVEDAIALVMKVMSKTMDSTTLGSEKLEFATLTLDPETKKPKAKIY
ncbi:667_t:CDS:2, partial [Acaulospora colombiana]